ncbi:hypothetical protein C5167_015103 [Papaver somniferum]|uniref:Uncharacterized protein n=1 Tax=Papaver somniferum TaxID=3469 RepID=A0A4Y7J713_PAPSO|nr:hypothetical protein C5167_015103 [Papaver somniferum]
MHNSTRDMYYWITVWKIKMGNKNREDEIRFLMGEIKRLVSPWRQYSEAVFRSDTHNGNIISTKSSALLLRKGQNRFVIELLIMQ